MWQILGKRATAGNEELEGEKMRRILQESEEALAVERSLISTSPTAETKIDIHDLVLQKLIEFKDKSKGKLKPNVKDDQNSNTYSSLDLFDWTSRSIG